MNEIAEIRPPQAVRLETMNSASEIAWALRQRLPVVGSSVANYYRAVSEPEDLAYVITSTVELPVLVFVLICGKESAPIRVFLSSITNVNGQSFLPLKSDNWILA